jgi:hypothetical protein
MTLQAAPLTLALFFMAAMVLAGFTVYAHRAGKIRRAYTLVAGALLGLIFCILCLLFTSDAKLASVVGLVIFGWFYALTRLKTGKFNP